MLIGLGILEIASMYKAIKILKDRSEDAIIEISKRGYKIDFDKSNEDSQESEELVDINEKPLIEKREYIPTILPGLNLLYAYLKRKKYINDFMKDLENNDSLVKLTKEEEEKFKSLNNKTNQFLFTLFCMTKEYEEEEFIGIDDNSEYLIYSLDNGKQLITSDSLLSISYKLDDVKRINSVKEGKYKIGNIDGINIAIIGILDDDLLFKRLSFKRDNFERTYEFKEMNEEDAINKRFVIYPFIEDELYDKEVAKIIDERNKKEIVSTQLNINFIKSKKLVLSNRRY